MGRRRSLDDKQRARVVVLYRDHGLSTPALAERFGCTNETVAATLRAAGIEIEKHRTYFAGVAGDAGRGVRRTTSRRGE